MSINNNYKVSYDTLNENEPMVAIITEEQAIELSGQSYDGYGSLFYPIQDANDNWVISQIEIESNVNAQFSWVNNLALVDYNPKPEIPWW